MTSYWVSLYVPLLWLGFSLGAIGSFHVYRHTRSFIDAFGSFLLGPTVAVIASATLFSYLY